ncbi:kinase [uncultured Nitrospira sp.]|uniref:GHMP family kinase ATP-binding protein n=1 Tax=uncultured Nitrospira sp. TaxID=157176 RepID=UPI003140B3E4
MIISRTPYRLSFFGGGTDYPQWYLREEGAVLSTTIDKYCYVSCRYLPPFFNIKHRIVWSHIETVSTIGEILHPAVREGLRFLGFDDSQGVEIQHQGDLPARSGIGSSSSFSVGLVKALTGLKGEMLGKMDLARQAFTLERDILKETVGSQDQVAAAFGGFNVIRFLRDGQIQVEPLTLSLGRLAELEQNLVLLYTGTSRLGSDIAKNVANNISLRSAELKDMHAMVDKGLDILSGTSSLEEFGKLLHKSWMLKRSLSEGISNSTIDEIYKKALDNGAIGGKLSGAGGSGFMLFYVPISRQAHFLSAMNPYVCVPFSFSQSGSSIIYYDGADRRVSGGCPSEVERTDKDEDVAHKGLERRRLPSLKTPKKVKEKVLVGHRS